ncbi:MAG: mechanosensitive ion channel [Spirochaetales bacterium]|nr:mechanosensitive ion channel [Spirochaetales bacterium]
MSFWKTITNLITRPISLGKIDFPFNLLNFIFLFLLPVLVILIAYKLINLGIKKLIMRGHLKETLKNRLYRWIRLAIRLVVVTGIILLFGKLFGAEMGVYLNMFLSVLNVPIIEAGSTKITFVTIIMTIPVFYLASWIGKLTKSFVDQSVLGNLGIDESKKFSISAMTRYGMMIVVLLVGLSIIGIDLSSLAVLFGVLGIGLGFGLQNTVANFFAGVNIIFTQPVKEGDRILVNDVEGTVVQIKLLSTVIGTLTHEIIILPNSKIIDNAVHNYSYNDRQIIIHNPIQVSYSSDLEKVLEVLLGIGKDNPYRLQYETPIARIVSFDDSGITLKLLLWIRDVSDKYDALHWNNLEIWRRFKAEGISIPFPQLDIAVKNYPSGENPGHGTPPGGTDEDSI